VIKRRSDQGAEEQTKQVCNLAGLRRSKFSSPAYSYCYLCCAKIAYPPRNKDSLGRKSSLEFLGPLDPVGCEGGNSLFTDESSNASLQQVQRAGAGSTTRRMMSCMLGVRSDSVQYGKAHSTLLVRSCVLRTICFILDAYSDECFIHDDWMLQ
jgi:hypothetical protein